MGRNPKIRPSFFKVLIKDYTSRLSLPHVFVQKYAKFLPESAKIRTSSGETWDVKLQEIDDDEKYSFTQGWNKFVKDLGLELGEFLVFWFNIGKSTFDVSVYGVDGCERKKISAKNVPAMDTDADEDHKFRHHRRNVPDVKKKRLRSCMSKSEAAENDDETKSANFSKKTNPRIEIVLTKGRKWRVCLRKAFAKASGLIGKRAVVLEYPPKQRYWPVILDLRQRPYCSLEMAVGWADFRRENGLVLGKTYLFDFDPIKNVIQVKEHKKRRSVR